MQALAVLASGPDLLRLLAVPFFGYAAIRDIRTRRVPNELWYPLAIVAIVALGWEVAALLTGPTLPIAQRRFFLQVMISLGFVIPLAYGFWLMGGFGGADAKAFFVIAVLFPTYPTYDLATLGLEWLSISLPLIETSIGVFSLTILTNAVLVGLAYPIVLAGRNAMRGYISPGMFVARPIPPTAATDEYGTLLEFPDRSLASIRSVSDLRAYFRWRGLDLDALRMYLSWRDCTLEELRMDPAAYRDPDSVPTEPHDPGDGTIVTDGGGQANDPWGAEAFLADLDGNAYGTTPDGLRAGLDALSTDDVVWISPGIPFIVPLVAGLIVALLLGDLSFAVLRFGGFV